MDNGTNLQWRFVFTSPYNESTTYSLVQPVLAVANSEVVDDQDAITVRNQYVIDPDNPEWPPGAPRVNVQVDQRTGQVNVCVGPRVPVEVRVARTPAGLRVQPRMPPRPIPPPDKILKPDRLPHSSRAEVPSPSGMAIRTPGGFDFVPAGSIRTPGNTVWTPKGSSYSPGGTSYWPIGTVFTEENGVVTPAGTTYTPTGIGYGTHGHVYTPGGTAYSPSGVARTSWGGDFGYEIAPQSPTAYSPAVSSPGHFQQQGVRCIVLSPPPPTPQPIAPLLSGLGHETRRRPIATPNLASVTESQPAFYTSHDQRVVHQTDIPMFSPMYPQVGPVDSIPSRMQVVEVSSYWPPEPPENIPNQQHPARPVYAKASMMVSGNAARTHLAGGREDVYSPMDVI